MARSSLEPGFNSVKRHWSWSKRRSTKQRMNSVHKLSRRTSRQAVFLKDSLQTWIRTSWEIPHRVNTTTLRWTWTMVTTTMVKTITTWIIIKWVSHITWLITSQTITIIIQIIITSITTMWRMWPRTSSSTSIAPQTVILMLRTSCHNTPWTLLWALLSSNRPHHSQWVPISSSKDSTIKSHQKP